MRIVLRLLIPAFLLLSCGTDASRVNVLLIGVDTLRPDHLGCYGYQLATSPNIDSLAANGVIFDTTVSQCPWTLPSFASVFTSLYPTQHGAGINMSTMRTTFPTLANILAEAGYTTGAVLSSPVLSSEFGLARGFSHYHVTPSGEERDALEATDLALSWLDGLDGRPFFLFVHYFDPHLPYAPPEPYHDLFGDGRETSIGTSFDLKPLLEDDIALRDQLAGFTAADWKRIVSLYDGEIGFTDMAIGRLLSGVRERGLERNTLIVLLSDHGEEFFEHGGLGHGHTLYNEVIRVPLIFALQGVLPRGVRVGGQVRLVDVAPTVLAILGIEGGYGLEGASLLGTIEGGGRARARSGSLFPARMAYSEGLRRGSERKSVSAYPWKIIHDTRTGSDRVFNLEDDPRELDPVAGTLPEAIPLLKDALLGSLIKMGDTWYVEMVPDPASSEFSLHISVAKGLSVGSLTFCRCLTADGAIRDLDRATIERSGLTIRELSLAEPLTLAFQVDAPPGLPVTFDLSVDGESATDRTYLGEKLLQPSDMPFSTFARRKSLRCRGLPSRDCHPPYFLVWRSEAGNPGRTAADLGAETKEALRALGYIQ